jgi:hypothetical protein
MSYMFRRSVNTDGSKTIPQSFPALFGSKATDMSYMFTGVGYGVETGVNIPNFPAQFGSVATNMSHMFDMTGVSNTNLTQLFPAQFGSKATDMSYMFHFFDSDSENLSPLVFPTDFGKNATNMSYMFYAMLIDAPTSSISITFPTKFGDKLKNAEKMFDSFAEWGNSVSISIYWQKTDISKLNANRSDMFDNFLGYTSGESSATMYVMNEASANWLKQGTSWKEHKPTFEF